LGFVFRAFAFDPLEGEAFPRQLDVLRVDLDTDPIPALAFGYDADGAGTEERIEYHSRLGRCRAATRDQLANLVHGVPEGLEPKDVRIVRLRPGSAGNR